VSFSSYASQIAEQAKAKNVVAQPGLEKQEFGQRKRQQQKKREQGRGCTGKGATCQILKNVQASHAGAGFYSSRIESQGET
jgi:hypothetical protein